VTAQDPLGVSLIASLVLKETPFLVWMLWTLLARGDVAARFAGHWRSARSLGHGSLSIWLRIVLPQLLPRLLWPLVIVWVFGATVVDMALVIGPAQPPTLAVLIWADLNDAAAASNDRGAAGALFLTLALGVAGTAATLALRWIGQATHRFLAKGPSPRSVPQTPGYALMAVLASAYGAVILLLALMSVAGHWPFPHLLPSVFLSAAWTRLIADFGPLAVSLGLGVITAASGLALAVLWFECTSARLDRLVMAAAVLALGLPALVTAAGQYRIFLHGGLTGTLAGLFLVHLTAVFAYVFVVLKGPYRAFDPRFRSVSLGLNTTAVRFWLRVKAPLLRAPLAAAGAVGFAVSMAQFVPAQLIAAGRYSTLPMEAVTLASGGNRPLTATYALAMTIPPALVFIAASLTGRSRWS
jgi:putative thiamine transport system permease protein